ncbi:hypothetical protein BZ17_4307 (plasmid) [Yersinia pseudotuberculosis IP 32953]|uniref:Uncharacterized protein n=1 Tax=Yersinia pseudotuberculosis serotype I (strain IP32953) TaxID=273123 RepID=Q663D3_YERPS|nr:hypothetical protein [Yersinia pseudotuberculosis]AJJ53085.1 hypothetical protein BZ17_4307 [Yersinia pseudotuberculosis IP 32953]CAF25463.1 hypothetical protein pYptb0021 [Yersinia pseudotuberculosis IP 32953]
MGTRIENPNRRGACFIAENILKRLDKDAVRRCGSYDRLYAVFLKENIYEFADTLESKEREKFLFVAREIHCLDEVPSINEVMKKISLEQF